MKEFRKILAMILCAVLCLSLLPAAAFAEEGQEQEQEQDDSVIAEEIVVEEDAAELPEEVTKEPETGEKHTDPDIVEDTLIIEEENFSEESMAAWGTIDFVKGTWGNLKWVLSNKEGKLSISGNGKMNDFAQKSTEAWREYKDKIKSVKIDSGVTNIGKFAFYDCSNITDVTIPEGVTIIDEDAFVDCYNLTGVTIPESVTIIENDAFENCENLTSITFPEGIKYIGDDAFRGCINLTSVTIPNSVVRIESYAFSGCSSLKEIRFCDGPPEYLGYNSIRDNAFQGVTATAYYPANLYWKEEDIQNYGGELTWVQYELECKEGKWGNLTWYLDMKTLVLTISGNGKMDDFAYGSHESHGAWHNYAGVYKSVQINSGVTSIGERAFDNSSFLTSVTIPESVTSIGASAFDGCFSLTSVTIPENITSIGTYAFYYCKSLKEIRFLGAPPSISDTAFTGVTADAYYSADQGWTAANMQNYGGSLTWVDADSEDPPEAFVQRGYSLMLGREASAEEVQFYADQLKAEELTGAQMVSNFMNSPEFAVIASKLSSEEIVGIIYETMLDRVPSEEEAAYHAANLEKGYSYNAIINCFSQSPEFLGICEEAGIEAGTAAEMWRDKNILVTAFVKRNYKLTLVRDAAGEELDYYCERLLQKYETPQQVANHFVFSPECVGRGLSDEQFITMLYNLYMDRDPDADGLTFYENLLASGVSREQIEANFGASPEFAEIVKSYGL